MPVPRAYFDNAATTPLDPRVLRAMRPYLGGSHGNASSMHVEGRDARAAVERARAQVAALVGASPSEAVFTASGTEADNLAVFGAVAAPGGPPAHVITSSIEHPAVLEPCRELSHRGAAVTHLPVDGACLVDPDSLRGALRPDTGLVSIMAANNVTGTIQPIAALSRIAHDAGALFHTDAVQAAGRVPIDVVRDGIDLLTLSAHKLYGPQGVGALVVRKSVRLQPLVRGGGQEHGLRSGTENVAGIVGFGAACEICRNEMADEAVRLVALRETLIEGILERLERAYVVGDRHRRLPGHACLALAGTETDTIRLLLGLDEAGFAVSTSSACSSHRADQPSSVLLAMGFDPVRARSALRVTLGRFNTPAEVERFVAVLPSLVGNARPLSNRTSVTLERSLS